MSNPSAANEPTRAHDVCCIKARRSCLSRIRFSLFDLLFMVMLAAC
jgi:hypothetical protein